MAPSRPGSDTRTTSPPAGRARSWPEGQRPSLVVASVASGRRLVRQDAGRPDEWHAGKLAINNGQLDGGWADRDNEYITHGYNALGTATPGPCHTNCTNNNEVYSFHQGGAMHAFGDGSVRFVKQSMNIRLFVKLLTRSGDDIVNDF